MPTTPMVGSSRQHNGRRHRRSPITSTPPNSGPARPGAAISLRGLSRAFGGADAVLGLDLDIAPGEIYGFLGPNGAGKSTTVRMLCTLLAPSEGTALVAGHDVVEAPEQVRLRIGAALQDISLDPGQTGRELLRLQGRLYGLSRDRIDQRMKSLAAMVDLGDALDHRIGTYSGGMRRRLDLAAALVHSPEVLFLDEPTTGLDPASRALVWEEVRTLNQQLGMTIFLTTQYLEEADALAGRIGIINGGRLVAEGTPDELKRRVGGDVVIATVSGDTDVARRAVNTVAGIDDIDGSDGTLRIATGNGATTIGPIAIALDHAGVELRDLTLRSTSLDDVFLELTGNRIRPDSTDSTDSTEPEETR